MSISRLIQNIILSLHAPLYMKEKAKPRPLTVRQRSSIIIWDEDATHLSSNSTTWDHACVKANTAREAKSAYIQSLNNNLSYKYDILHRNTLHTK